jgi:hypothetical protein
VVEPEADTPTETGPTAADAEICPEGVEVETVALTGATATDEETPTDVEIDPLVCVSDWPMEIPMPSAAAVPLERQNATTTKPRAMTSSKRRCTYSSINHAMHGPTDRL